MCLTKIEQELFSIAPWRTIEIFHKASVQLKQEMPLPEYVTKIAQHTSSYEQFIRDLWEAFKLNPTKANAKLFIDAIVTASPETWEKFFLDILNITDLTLAQRDLLEEETTKHIGFLQNSLMPDLMRGIDEGRTDFTGLDYRTIFLYSGALWSAGMLATVMFDGLDFRDLADVFIFAGPNDKASCTGPRGCVSFANRPYLVAQIIGEDIVPGHMRCFTNCRHMLIPVASPLTADKQFSIKGGPGSGHWGHAGRPNRKGGSLIGTGGLSSLGLDSNSSLLKRHTFAAMLTQEKRKLKPEINKIAEKLGYDPKLIKYVGEPRKFEVGGVKYTAGADYNTQTGIIRVYSGALTHKMTGNPKLNRGLMAHEIQHDRWNQFNTKAAAERKEIAQRLTAESAKGVHYSKSFIKPDGTYRLAADRKKYKLSITLENMVHAEMKNSKYSKADGITPYSTSYWKAYQNTKSTTDFYKAVNETLAELARLKVVDSLASRHQIKTMPKLWKDLDKVVGDAYESR